MNFLKGKKVSESAIENPKKKAIKDIGFSVTALPVAGVLFNAAAMTGSTAVIAFSAASSTVLIVVAALKGSRGLRSVSQQLSGVEETVEQVTPVESANDKDAKHQEELNEALKVIEEAKENSAKDYSDIFSPVVEKSEETRKTA